MTTCECCGGVTRYDLRLCDTCADDAADTIEEQQRCSDREPTPPFTFAERFAGYGARP